MNLIQFLCFSLGVTYIMQLLINVLGDWLHQMTVKSDSMFFDRTPLLVVGIAMLLSAAILSVQLYVVLVV